MSFLTSLLGPLVTLFIWFMGRFKKSSADKVATTDHALLEDAVNRTDPDDVSRDMRSGNF